MNKFECLCAHINCGNGYVAGWKSVKYTYSGASGIILEVTYADGDVRAYGFTNMTAATKFITRNFKWKSTGSAA